MLFNNDKAVSPIVATLVLIVVAIAGAAAVGTIMGSFSSDVADQTNAEDTTVYTDSLSIEGSTTVQPVSEKLAEAYMDLHPTVQVTVGGGGSGAGIAGTEMELCDIGAASKDINPDEHPDLEVFQIGGSAVVAIVNGIDNVNQTTKAELGDIYANVAEDGTVGVSVSSGNLTYLNTSTTKITVYQRAESSGTEETFAKYLPDVDDDHKFHTDENVDSSNAVGKNGNAGVLAAVKDNDEGCIGFVDFGYADGEAGVTIISVDREDEVTSDSIKAALKGDSSAFPADLTRPLNYMTLGTPDDLEQEFINFARSPASAEYFDEVGYFSILELQ